MDVVLLMFAMSRLGIVRSSKLACKTASKHPSIGHPENIRIHGKQPVGHVSLMSLLL